MTQQTLEKYGVRIHNKKEVSGSFLSIAKKHIIKNQKKEKENLSENIDSILYGN